MVLENNDDDEEGEMQGASIEAIEAKRKKIKKIIENRRKYETFKDAGVRTLNLAKTDGIIGFEEAKIENVFSDKKFEDIGLAPPLLKSLNKMNFTTLTRV